MTSLNQVVKLNPGKQWKRFLFSKLGPSTRMEQKSLILLLSMEAQKKREASLRNCDIASQSSLGLNSPQK